MKKILVISVIILISTSVISQDSYPYNGKCSGGDVWNFVYGNCTSYVGWKLNEAFDNSPKSNFHFKNSITNPKLSHAKYWDEKLAYLGYYVSSVPTPGAIAQWNAGEKNASKNYGHVGYVEEVYPNGSAKISEYNAKGKCKYSSNRVSSAPRYIRYNKFELVGNIDVNNDSNKLYKTGGNSIKCEVKNTSKEETIIEFRCGLYKHKGSTYEFMGEIAKVKKTLNGYQTIPINFSKETFSSKKGDYKIWIECRASSNSPWTILHKPNVSSTHSVVLEDKTSGGSSYISPSNYQKKFTKFNDKNPPFKLLSMNLTFIDAPKYDVVRKKNYFETYNYKNDKQNKNKDFYLLFGTAKVQGKGEFQFLGQTVDKNNKYVSGVFVEKATKKKTFVAMELAKNGFLLVRYAKDFNYKSKTSLLK